MSALGGRLSGTGSLRGFVPTMGRSTLHDRSLLCMRECGWACVYHGQLHIRHVRTLSPRVDPRCELKWRWLHNFFFFGLLFVVITFSLSFAMTCAQTRRWRAHSEKSQGWGAVFPSSLSHPHIPNRFGSKYITLNKILDEVMFWIASLTQKPRVSPVFFSPEALCVQRGIFRNYIAGSSHQGYRDVWWMDGWVSAMLILGMYTVMGPWPQKAYM